MDCNPRVSGVPRKGGRLAATMVQDTQAVEPTEASTVEVQDTQAVSMTDAEMEALITEKIHDKHTLDFILQQSKTAEEWSTTIDRMIPVWGEDHPRRESHHHRLVGKPKKVETNQAS